jgi:transposase
LKIGYCGIDLSKEKAWAQVISATDEVIGKPFVFERNMKGPKGPEKCIKTFEPFDQVVVGFESTANYGKVLGKFFEERGYKVIEINPIETSVQEKKRVRKIKSDPTNAYDIAVVTRRKWNTESQFDQDPDLLLARKLVRLKKALKSNISRYKLQIRQNLDLVNPGLEKCIEDLWCKSGLAILKKYPTLGHLKRAGIGNLTSLIREVSRGRFGEEKAREILETCDMYLVMEGYQVELGKAIKMMVDLIQQHEKRIEQLERSIVKKIPADELELVRSITGIGDETAGVVITESGPGENFRNDSQYIAYIGLDPSVRESGNWTGKSKLSKRGPPMIREALYQASLNGVQNNPVLRLIHREKLMEGRESKEAIVIASRYLAKIIRSVRFHRRPFYVPDWVKERLPEVDQRFVDWKREQEQKGGKR